MCWHKRDVWKVSIAIASILLLLVLMAWIPVSEAGAYEGVSGLATPGTGTVQAMPTEAATVTALNKERLKGEIAQQQHTENWLWSNGATILSGFFSTLVIVIGALIAFWRWRGDQRTEQEKRAEERFQAAVEGLSSEREEAKVGAAITLRTFLRPGYEQFYTQVFDLAIVHLRLPKTPNPPEDPNTPLPLTTLSQALIVAFKEAFPLARAKLLKEQGTQFRPQSLDATGICLDNAFLWKADLKQVWIPEAFLREIHLSEADLSGASLWRDNLSRASLREANLGRADLGQVNLHKANLHMAQLRGATLWGADLREADLRGADLSRADPRKDMPHGAADPRRDKREASLLLADLREANLSGADLEEAKLCRAKLCKAKFLGIRLTGPDLTKTDVGQVKLTEIRFVELDHSEPTNRNALKWGKLRQWANHIDINAYEADLHAADPYEANLRVNLHKADLRDADLSGVNIEEALSLKDTDLRGVRGLTKVQLEACKAKGAIIDEDSTISPLQSPGSPPATLQSNDVQSPSTPSVQGNTPTSDTAGNSTAPSSKPSLES